MGMAAALFFFCLRLQRRVSYLPKHPVPRHQLQALGKMQLVLGGRRGPPGQCRRAHVRPQLRLRHGSQAVAFSREPVKEEGLLAMPNYTPHPPNLAVSDFPSRIF